MFGSFKAVKVGKSTITIARPLANLPGDLAARKMDVIEASFGCDTMILEIHRSVSWCTHAYVHHSNICVLNRSNVNLWVRTYGNMARHPKVLAVGFLSHRPKWLGLWIYQKHVPKTESWWKLPMVAGNLKALMSRVDLWAQWGLLRWPEGARIWWYRRWYY